MDIDEFLDKETSHLEGKARIMSSEFSPSKEDEEMNIFKQMKNVREEIHKKNLGPAWSEFTVLRDHYFNMTKKQLQDNRLLLNELLKLNNELIANIGILSQDTLKNINLIRKLLNNARESLRQNKVDEASRFYHEIKNIYEEIPDVFQEEKNRINSEILSFYILLSSYTEAFSKQQFLRNKAILKRNISTAYIHIKTKQSDLLISDFEKISEIYEQFPEGFTQEKALLYLDILRLFSSAYLMDNKAMLSQPVVPEQILKQQKEMGDILKAAVKHQPIGIPQVNQQIMQPAINRLKQLSIAAKTDNIISEPVPVSTATGSPQLKTTADIQEPSLAAQIQQPKTSIGFPKMPPREDTIVQKKLPAAQKSSAAPQPQALQKKAEISQKTAETQQKTSPTQRITAALQKQSPAAKKQQQKTSTGFPKMPPTENTPLQKKPDTTYKTGSGPKDRKSSDENGKSQLIENNQETDTSKWLKQWLNKEQKKRVDDIITSVGDKKQGNVNSSNTQSMKQALKITKTRRSG